MIAAPDLSIVIATAERRDLLAECLDSIEGIPDDVTYEVVVVDNGSADRTAEMLASRFPSVHLIRNERNTGFAHATNQGLAASRGRHLLLLNNDTTVRPHALERLVRFLDCHPAAGACAPALFYPDGRPQRSVLAFPTLRGHLSSMLFLHRLFPRARAFAYQEIAFDHTRPARVEQPIAAALLVRREVYESVGPLDERFRIHYNDVDWCLRIHRAGWEIHFLPEAEVVHHSGSTVRDPLRRQAVQAEIVRNMFAYYAKHYGPAGLLALRTSMLLGYGLRRLTTALGRIGGDPEAHRERAELYRGLMIAAWRGEPLDPSFAGAGDRDAPARESAG